MQNAHLAQSTTLASLLQNQYTKRVGRKDREVQQAGFLVLHQTSMPSVLTELGFISNANEQRFLMSSEGQEFMASAIFRAIRDYKKEIEGKQSLTMNAAETASQTEVSQADVSQEIRQEVAGPSHAGVTYKLQIFSSAKILKLDHRSIKDLREVDYYVDGSLYKYTLGYSANIEEIKKIKLEYRNKYNGCFIVAFQNGERISMAEAKKINSGQ